MAMQVGGAGSIGFALPLILMFGVMYFLLFLPMQRQKKKTQQMVSSLKAGDNVITTGGIVGTITALDDNTITLRVRPDNVKLQFSRAAVTGLVPSLDATTTK